MLRKLYLVIFVKGTTSAYSLPKAKASRYRGVDIVGSSSTTTSKDANMRMQT